MAIYVFDIETNGFLDATTECHCLVIKQVGADHTRIHNNQKDQPNLFGFVDEGVRFLMDRTLAGDLIVAHNGIKFDIPALQKLYPWFQPDESRVIDTLVLARLLFADIQEYDQKLVKAGRLPAALTKRHSLEAWGHRLGAYKGDFEGPWDRWSPEMEAYCAKDVEVLERLYSYLVQQSAAFSVESIELEHKVAWIVAHQERQGFFFDREGAANLYSALVGRRIELEREIRAYMPEFYLRDGKTFVPKKGDKKRGYEAGAAVTKVKLTEFNPGSRDHIALVLRRKYGWKPKALTAEGKAQIDEPVLAALPYPMAKPLLEYLTVEKRIGQLAEGQQAWLRQVKGDNRIHGSVITNGAVTGRATHNGPNIGQVPACGAPYGEECRELFCVPDGKVLVGSDLSGLELRCLAHFMARYDGGAYGKILLEGDIHTANQEAAGLPTRAMAKTFIYGFLYGAGAAKIGSIVGKGAQAGQKLKDAFLAKLPALKKLLDAVQAAARAGSLKGLDGRRVAVRSAHSALNTLLQSAGALIAKQWLIEIDSQLRAEGLIDRAHQVAWVHDEVEFECDPEVAERVGQICIEAAARAGERFQFRIPIAAEAKLGTTWKDVH